MITLPLWLAIGSIAAIILLLACLCLEIASHTRSIRESNKLLATLLEQRGLVEKLLDTVDKLLRDAHLLPPTTEVQP